MIADGGILHESLGTTENPLPAPSALDRPLWVGVSVDGTPEMRPLTGLSTAVRALNVADEAVTTAKLADGAVTSEKIAADYVSSVTVDGMRVTPRGGALNLTAGEGLQLSFDEDANIVRVGVPRTLSANGTGSTNSTNGCSSNSDGTKGTNQVTGGCTNTIFGSSGHAPIDFSTISGGESNTITDVVDATSPRFNGPDEGTNWHVISGGKENKIVTDVHHSEPEDPGFGAMTIGGGQANFLCGPWGVIGGGQSSTISSHIPVWDDDLAVSLMWDVIAGGVSNTITQVAGRSVISGGEQNTIQGVASWDLDGVGSPISSAFYSAIGGGLNNTITSDSGAIAGGTLNTVAAPGGAIAGGGSNTITSTAIESSIAGGVGNSTDGPYAFIGAGFYNQANQELASTVGGAWLATSGQGQTVLGWLNLPSGNGHLLGAGRNDDRIFEIGSPIKVGNLFTPANAFEVSYNGHSIVYHTNGTSLVGSPKVFQGATYVESPVYAWGQIDGLTGGAITSFGITQSTKIGLGTYMVTIVPADPQTGAIPTSIAQASITVTVVNDNTEDIVVAPPIPPGGEEIGTSLTSFESGRAIPDSLVQAFFGGSQPIPAGDVAASGASFSPLVLPVICGYATASNIGVLVPSFGSAYSRSFIVRTYSMGEQCQQADHTFFFKVCHR
jgi:hypothetical protein